jgi:rod shape-determining protein MreC
MSGLTPTRKNALLLVAVLFGHLVLISDQVGKLDRAGFIEDEVLRASRPVLRVTEGARDQVGGVAARLTEIRTARGENEGLRREVERLRSELGRYREDSAENERLRRLLEMREQLAPESLGAAVVSSNISGQTRMIVIDRGSNGGVKPDMAVVAWGGAVGRVISVEGSLAKVRLISDPNGGAAGVVQRSRAQGMVVGRGDGPMSMLYVPAYYDVVAGDRVVTSGKDGVFPRGFTIGRVAAVGGDPGVSKVISIEPEVDFGSLEEVLVVVDRTAAGPAMAGPGEE